MDEKKTLDLSDEQLENVSGGVNEAAATNQPVGESPFAEESQIHVVPTVPAIMEARF